MLLAVVSKLNPSTMILSIFEKNICRWSFSFVKSWSHELGAVLQENQNIWVLYFLSCYSRIEVQIFNSLWNEKRVFCLLCPYTWCISWFWKWEHSSFKRLIKLAHFEKWPRVTKRFKPHWDIWPCLCMGCMGFSTKISFERWISYCRQFEVILLSFLANLWSR